MMEFEFSPVEEPKKATEKHVKELNDKIDNLTKQVDCLENQLSEVLKILNTIASNDWCFKRLSERCHRSDSLFREIIRLETNKCTYTR